MVKTILTEKMLAAMSPEAQERAKKGLSVEGMGFTADPDKGLNLDALDAQINELLAQKARDNKKK